MSHAGSLESSQRRQLIWITLSAVALYAGLRWLPTGTNLSHMDFRVDPRLGTAIEFCDPANPQFIPVVAARSPVTLGLVTAEPPVAGQPVRAVVTLRTSSGKPITPVDLMVVHTRPLHLMIVDPTLMDYQHVHPEPGAKAGEWAVSFMPQSGGLYRVFADFTPAATARGLYASTDVAVSGTPATREEAATRSGATGALRFSLVAGEQPIRANRPINLQFSAWREDGAGVRLQPVMGAFAHLVAFDETRSGFAHLHPMEDVAQAPDLKQPVLNFKLTIPSAGRYVVWAQVNVGGEEMAVPFELVVVR